jgi:hypothetical protein
MATKDIYHGTYFFMSDLESSDKSSSLYDLVVERFDDLEERTAVTEGGN